MSTGDFSNELAKRLESIRSQHLFRELRTLDVADSGQTELNGRAILNFASNDYLGLARHPKLLESSNEAAQKYGCGAGASRLISGSWKPHADLEHAIADFKNAEAALSFSTGYAAAVGTIGSLMEKEDILVIDRLVHASIVDAARLADSKLRVFAHNDLNDLERKLRWADREKGKTCAASRRDGSQRPQVMIVTESVFSMDGDQAPLRDLVALKERFGAWLMIDEAHATGLFGKRRSGLSEEHGLSNRIEIQMGTLGKAIGAAGGYVCGSQTLIDYLVNRARSFIFSTAPPPACVAAARAGIELVQSEEGAALCARLWQGVDRSVNALASLPSSADKRPLGTSAILPIMIGDEEAATKISDALREIGIFVPAIRYPSVARGAARMRLTLSAAHSEPEISRLLEGLRALVR